MLLEVKKKWHFYQEDIEKQDLLSKEFSISTLLAQILINRGIDTPQRVDNFLNPSFQKIKDLTEINNLSKAAEIVLDHIKNKSKIMIYGDYDVDGITGTTLLVSALRKLDADCSFYIPHRYDEGYGLNKNAIKKAFDEGINLIITVDCGISNLEEIKYANSLGLQVLITDHHMPPEEIPPALAIVDPKLSEEQDSFFYNLAGVGVAFKLAEKIFELTDRGQEIYLEPYLDLVALGTVTDIVPLTDANRIFTIKGLELLNKGNRLGIKMLHKISNSNEYIDTKSIGFVLGPRLNAAGRLDDASVAVELLLTHDNDKALRLAASLNELNTKRRSIGEKIKEDALNIMENDRNKNDENIIVLKEHNWHPGIIGIVASQLAKRYNKPAALIAINNGIGRGSIRSALGIDILSPLVQCRELFVDYGGHKEAAGFTIEEENITEFIDKYKNQLNSSLDFNFFKPFFFIDALIKPAIINFDFIKELSVLYPHGQGNHIPVFASKNLDVIDYKLIGNNKQHLKMIISDKKRQYDAIGFNMGHYLQIVKNKQIDIVYTVEINNWLGKKTIQLNLIDID